MQIDEPERGFSWKHEGPLDLRLDQNSGEPASERLKELEWDELAGMLTENADEPYAEEIAKKVTRAIYHKEPVETTTQLAALVREAVTEATRHEQLKKGELEDLIKKSSTRTFQALRIDINQEYEVLYNMLEKLPEVLNDGGRVAILTFHSGEDRIVKKEFKRFYREGRFTEIAKDAIKPSKEECFRNPRARSAKLRWAIK
jgi:16S rRNA (cytosine1402-N4)-methyltransferase